MKIPLSQKLDRHLLGSTKERIALLNEIDIHTVGDLLEYFPRTHEDFSRPIHLGDLRADQKNLLLGEFVQVHTETTARNIKLVKALFQEKSSGGQVECVWFNNPRIKHRIPLNKEVLIVAKAKISYGKISLQSPEFETTSKAIHLGNISPVYREHDTLKSSWIRQKIHTILPQVEALSDILPDEVRAEHNLLSRDEAIREVHFPTSMSHLKTAQQTLAFEELFILQSKSLLRKRKWEDSHHGKGKPIPLNPSLITKFFDTLPFTPTNAQKICLLEVLKDLEKTTPMLRLLEGDVGSGKTLVALTAAIAVIQSGEQVAFLAPTEILAQQQYASFQKFCHAFDNTISIALLTGSVQGKQRAEVLQNLHSGNIQILIGTHAILEESVVFRSLGLVIIDEQHRFGVNQRESLMKKGTPHVLQMTATPIPRTLALVAFGDQDLSVVTELPPGRKTIQTRVISPESRKKVEYFIEAEIKKGRQVFVVCPLIEDSEKLEVKSVTEEFMRMEQVFSQCNVGLLHGKLKSHEKEDIMTAFKNKAFDILVSTAVVEVGVDIPNASIMLIEGAERFGLAQLHQFRGRVGRGEHQSYCFLFPTEKSSQRLNAMETEHCGFRLAEIDLEIRGPGHVYGIQQSGMPDMKMANISDPRIVIQARKSAEEFLDTHEGTDFDFLKIKKRQQVQRG